MAGYVALPRPGDTIKWILLPIGFLVGAGTRGLPDAEGVLRAVVVWVALELLIYQARYQWNDIRGFDADQRHPGGDRGRLPGPLEQRSSRVAWSAGTAAVKVVLAFGLCWWLDMATGLLALLLAVGVFGLAAVYETLRTTCTGRTEKVPSPVTPGVVAIWVAIGSGYALRAVTGLGLAVDLTDGRLVLVAVLTCWAFGTAWITSRWAVEATAFGRRDGRELRWDAVPRHAKEHQLALVRWLPRAVPVSVPDLSEWRAVEGRPAPSAPWSIAGVLAGGGAAVLGALLTSPGAGMPALMVCLILGAAAGAVLHAAGRRRPAVAVLVVPLLASGLGWAGVGDPVRACLPWFVLAVAQVCYLRQGRASMGHLPSLRRRDAVARPLPVRPAGAPFPDRALVPSRDVTWTTTS